MRVKYPLPPATHFLRYVCWVPDFNFPPVQNLKNVACHSPPGLSPFSNLSWNITCSNRTCCAFYVRWRCSLGGSGPFEVGEIYLCRCIERCWIIHKSESHRTRHGCPMFGFGCHIQELTESSDEVFVTLCTSRHRPVRHCKSGPRSATCDIGAPGDPLSAPRRLGALMI